MDPMPSQLSEIASSSTSDQDLATAWALVASGISGAAARTQGDEEPVRYWYDWEELWGEQPRL